VRPRDHKSSRERSESRVFSRKPLDGSPTEPRNNKGAFADVKWLISLFVGTLVFAAILQYAYAELIAPQFGYMRFKYTPPDLGFSLPALAAAYVVGVLLPRSLKRPSDAVLWMLWTLVVLPISLVPFYAPGLKPGEALLLALGTCALFAGIRAVVSLPELNFVPVNRSSAGLFWAFVVGFSGVTYVYMLATFGFEAQLTSLTDVYGTRFEYRDSLTAAGPILAYLIFNQGNVVNTFLITYAVWSRRWVLLVVGVLGQMWIFSATGYKTVALSIPVCIAIGWLVSRSQAVNGRLLIHSVNAVAVGAIFLDSIKDSGLVNILINRMLITAGHLTPIYVDVYQDQEKAVWAYSFLKGIVPDPYGTSPAFFVGEAYYGNPALTANANLIADGYANLGVAGVLIEAAFLIVLLLAINSAARRLPLAPVLGTMILPSFALANGSPFSAALTFGFVLATVLLALVPRDRFVNGLPGEFSRKLGKPVPHRRYQIPRVS
jgi:hypothetical protein